MEYPKKYPDGFMEAVRDEVREKINLYVVIEGLDFFAEKLCEIVRDCRVSDNPLLIMSLRSVLGALEQQEDAKLYADVLSCFIGTKVTWCTRPVDKE